MKIGIIGLGVVGGAIKQGMLKLGYTVNVHDLKYNTLIEDVLATDVCFICLPTRTVNGQCDVLVVEATIRELATYGYRGTVIIKSTVTPGTTDYLLTRYSLLEIAYSPEFLRERYAEIDFIENMDLLPIGTYSGPIFDKVRAAHGHYPKQVVRLTPKEAEFLKYFSNVFNALRIVFANDFASICAQAGVKYQNVKNAAVLRKSIPDFYLDSNDNLKGFGGACLPKDTEAFASYAAGLNPSLNLFKLIMSENALFDMTVLDGMRGSK